MAVDGGAAGLEQSRHHPNAGLSAQWPTDTRARAVDNESTGSDREIDELRTKITSMVQSEMVGEVLGMIKRWVQLEVDEATKRGRRVTDEQPITLQDLHEAMGTLGGALETLTKKI